MTLDEEIQSHLDKCHELFGAKGPFGDVALPLVTLPGWSAYFSRFDGCKHVPFQCTKLVRTGENRQSL